MSQLPAEMAMVQLESGIKKISSGQNEKKNDCRVQVAVRVRPFISKELVDSESSCVKTTDNKIIMGQDKDFDFDRVIDQDATQEEVYQWCMKDLLNKALEGYNATILAYGQTGSGKTYTMGTSNINLNDASEMGIIPRVIKEIFQIRKQSENQTEMVLKISYFEIYNDNIIDLLDPNAITGNSTAAGKKGKGANAAQNVYIREELDGSINLYGITEEKVNSPEEMLAALERGGMCRSTSATLMNQTSSRSHAVFTIFLEQHCIEDLYQSNAMEVESKQGEGLEQKQEDAIQGFRTSKLHFVDLAGSERIKKTGAVGNTLKEGININMGLLSLGNVISALTDPSKGTGKKHIPYRDSKLTRILQDSLGGNSNTLMVACVSPAESNFEESLNTLKYASRARRIKNKPVVNRDPQSALISSLKQQLQESHLEICKLRQLLIENNIQISFNEENTLNDSQLKRFSQDLLKMKQGGAISTILSASADTDAEELKNLRLAQVKIEKKIKELSAENAELKSRFYKEEIDGLQMQRERDEMRLKLEKIIKLVKEKGQISTQIKNPSIEINGIKSKLQDQTITASFLNTDLQDISIDVEQKSLVDEYYNQVEKLKKELQEKERAFKELQGEFEDGIKASLRDQQMLVEREKKIAVINRNLKRLEAELRKAKDQTKKANEESKRRTTAMIFKQSESITLGEETEEESDEDGDDDAEQFEKLVQDEEVVKMESQLKIEENQKKLKLSKVDGSINERNEKMRKLNQDQLLLQQQLLSKMKEQYHSKINNLEHEMKKIENQRDEALQKIVNSNPKEAVEQKQKIIESFKTKVQEMQLSLSEYKRKAKEQETLQKTVQSQEKQISSLGNEISKFKSLKTSLYKEMKKNNEEFEKFKLQKIKDIMIEKKKNVEKEKQIFKLKNQTRAQERLLFKKQEDIKKLIRSRDLIKKIIASSSNLANKRNRKKQSISHSFEDKQNISTSDNLRNTCIDQRKSGNSDILFENSQTIIILDDCLCKLIEAVEIGISLEKQEKEITATIQEIEEAQQKMIEFKLALEKSQRILDVPNNTSLTEEMNNNLDQKRMELEEWQSRLDSLEAKYEFQKQKIQELHKDPRQIEFDNLQNQLLSAPEYSSLSVQKLLLKNLLDRFGASTAELFKQQEKLEEDKIQMEDQQQFIKLLQNQKEICMIQMQQQIDDLQQQLQMMQQQQLQQAHQMISDSDSEYNQIEDIQTTRILQEESMNKLKTKTSPPNVIANNKYKSMRLAYQTDSSPFKKDQPDQIKLLQKQVNDLSRQLKQGEIRNKTLQNKNETLQQKYDDLKKSTCKDKFIGISKINNDEDSNQGQTQQQIQTTSNAFHCSLQQQSPLFSIQSTKQKENAGISSLKDRRRELKGKYESTTNQQVLQQQQQVQQQTEFSTNIESKEEKSLCFQYLMLDKVTNSEVSQLRTNQIKHVSLSQKRASLLEERMRSQQSTGNTSGLLQEQSEGRFSFGLSYDSQVDFDKDPLVLAIKQSQELSDKNSCLEVSETPIWNENDKGMSFLLNKNALADSDDLIGKTNNPQNNFKVCSSDPNSSIGSIFPQLSDRNSYEIINSSFSATTSSNGIIPIQEENLGSTQNQQQICVKYECVGKIQDAHNGQVFCVQSHENLLFSTSVKSMKIWDIESQKCISDIQAHTHFVKGLAIIEEDKWIATACDKYINIWDMISMQKVCTLVGHNVDIKQLHTDGNHILYSAGKGSNNYGAVATWDLRKQQVIEEREKNQDIFAVLPYNNVLYTASRDHYVRRINIENNQSMDSFKPPHYDTVTSLAILNGYLVSGSKDHNLKLWCTNPLNSTFKHTTYYSNEQVLCLESNKDKNLLYVGQKDGKIKVVTAQNNKFKDVSDITNGLSSVNCISKIQSHSADQMFVSGTSDKMIKIWKPSADSQQTFASLKQQCISQNEGNSSSSFGNSHWPGNVQETAMETEQ